MDDEDSAVSGRQRRILDVVQRLVHERGYPPTVREIAAAVGLRSPSTVTHHLKALEARGLLRREAHSPRAVDARESFSPRPGPAGAVQVPLLGTVAAGAPLLADQVIEEELALPESFVGRGGELFALRVKGESMIEAAIADGDVVIVRREQTAENGDVVVALIDDEATTKVFQRRNGHVELEPRNPLFDVIPGDDAIILGKVVCVLRRLP
ncbi:transcriptional repressor LexA [Winogradskya humida]|uniref:LexA repressor n=1 Tax=Winogradskya humida TaxID=113566 RepID=A0ABQ3ZGT0_9ACTN|nr:transcriptional repressor LexA [Actinoplanes humidus]GIE17773.1 LexA repressor [Actinoplanes humidus]